MDSHGQIKNWPLIMNFQVIKCTESDSSIDNLDHLCTAESTEFKLKDNIPGFEYISKMGHHGWTPVRVQRVGVRETEFDAAFLRSVRKFLMWVVL